MKGCIKDQNQSFASFYSNSLEQGVRILTPCLELFKELGLCLWELWHFVISVLLINKVPQLPQTVRVLWLPGKYIYITLLCALLFVQSIYIYNQRLSCWYDQGSLSITNNIINYNWVCACIAHCVLIIYPLVRALQRNFKLSKTFTKYSDCQAFKHSHVFKI